jgi:hypothetical protein
MKHLIIITLFIVTLTIAGCGRRGLSGLTAVEGVVSCDGQPLAEATVMFYPVSADGRSAVARTDANGKFVLTTLNPNDGITPGDYQVGISKFDDALTSLLPEKYGNKLQSGFAATVPSGGVKDLRFDLTTEGWKPKKNRSGDDK